MSEVMQPGAESEELRRAVDVPTVATPVSSPRVEWAKADVSGSICIHHGGRAFVASATQAGIFLRRAQEIAAQGHAELVPLLHSNGVEMLFITARTPLQVHDSRDLSFSTGHRSAPAA